jgi:hypothetical protein
MKNIAAGEPFPGCREDFDSDDAWQYWRTLETAHLSQLTLVLVQFNPELAKSAPTEMIAKKRAGSRPGSIYGSASPSTVRNGSIGSRRSLALSPHMSMLSETDYVDVAEEIAENDDEVEAGHNFTYIPPNPKKYFRRLLEFCLEADLAAMRDPNVSDDDQVSLGILSPLHLELINECALRWRISQPYRAACFLDIIRQLYDRNEVPLDCVPEALGAVSKVMHEISYEKWPVADVGAAPLLLPARAYACEGRLSRYCLRWDRQHISEHRLPRDGQCAEPEARRRHAIHRSAPAAPGDQAA